jgi:arabinose-5-phosphate isomerase
LAIGDALAIALAQKRGFKEEDFADLHPGGRLGKQLLRVENLMHTGDAIPMVRMETSMRDVIYEISRKGLGATAVVDAEHKVAGIITDGDLRRLFQEDEGALRKTAGECMHPNPLGINRQALAVAALKILEEKKITSLLVVDSQRNLEGIVHLHDLWQTQMI